MVITFVGSSRRGVSDTPAACVHRGGGAYGEYLLWEGARGVGDCDFHHIRTHGFHCDQVMVALATSDIELSVPTLVTASMAKYHTPEVRP